MSIFGGESTPQWMSGKDIYGGNQPSAGETFLSSLAQGWQASNDKAEAAGAPTKTVPAWLAPFSGAADKQSQERQEFDMMKAAAMQKAKQLDQTQAFQTQAAGLFQGADTPDKIFSVISDHPWLQFNPATAKQTEAISKSAAQAAQIQIAGAKAAMNTRQNTSFYKQLDELSKAGTDGTIAAAQINQMTPNKDGTPTPKMLRALQLAAEAHGVSVDNDKTAAEMSAAGSGDTKTVTVTPKGVTERFTPKKAENPNATAEPVVKTYDGQDFVYSPRTGKLQKLSKTGAPAELTTSELTKLATATGVDTNMQAIASQKILDLLQKKPATTPEASSQYKSPEEVRAAVQSGKLKKDEAVQILKSKFNYQ